MRFFPEVQRASTLVGSGMHPAFSRDGELFYFDGGGLSAATVEYEPSLVVGPAQALFRGTYWYGIGGTAGEGGRAWDPDPAGDRFLMILPPGQSAADGRLHVVVNWAEELRVRAPAR
jgi:hypothetical protein